VALATGWRGFDLNSEGYLRAIVQEFSGDFPRILCERGLAFFGSAALQPLLLRQSLQILQGSKLFVLRRGQANHTGGLCSCDATEDLHKNKLDVERYKQLAVFSDAAPIFDPAEDIQLV
jgi:hypothetical protein